MRSSSLAAPAGEFLVIKTNGKLRRNSSNQSMKPTAPNQNERERPCHDILPWLISISLDGIHNTFRGGLCVFITVTETVGEPCRLPHGATERWLAPELRHHRDRSDGSGTHSPLLL